MLNDGVSPGVPRIFSALEAISFTQLMHDTKARAQEASTRSMRSVVHLGLRGDLAVTQEVLPSKGLATLKRSSSDVSRGIELGGRFNVVSSSFTSVRSQVSSQLLQDFKDFLLP